MPIYEYRCTACGRHLEKRQKFSDAELTVCPTCDGRLEKQISAPAIQFKGGGWYADGYGNTRSGGTTDTSAPAATDSTPAATTAAPAKAETTAAPSTPAPAAKPAK